MYKIYEIQLNYLQMFRFDPEYGQIRTCTESKVKIHHSSVNKAYPKKSKSGDNSLIQR